jgi:hypothetical protein
MTQRSGQRVARTPPKHCTRHPAGGVLGDLVNEIRAPTDSSLRLATIGNRSDNTISMEQIEELKQLEKEGKMKVRSDDSNDENNRNSQ